MMAMARAAAVAAAMAAKGAKAAEAAKAAYAAKSPTKWKCNICNKRSVELCWKFGKWPPAFKETTAVTGLAMRLAPKKVCAPKLC